jgi:UDP-N-acetylmuramate dehydrogenase
MQLEIQENLRLAPLTTLGVGGEARFFVEAKRISDVEEAVGFAKGKSLPLFVLGGGSNVVVSDRGWNGLVLRVGIAGIERKEDQGKQVFEVGAGVDWDEFVAHTVSLNCAGLECLSGIPGSVGGAPVQNVGAYGQEVCETIGEVLVFDELENSLRQLSSAECEFNYRSSLFNASQRGRFIVVRVAFALVPNGPPALRYADLQKYFAERDGTPTLGEVRDAVRTIRARKGMLISPGDPDSRSAGSFFKNPVLSPAQHDDLVRRAADRGLKIPSYPALSQQRKVSAAWLVENSGFPKGYVRGRAAVSSKHALAIVNRGGATAAEIIELRDEIQLRVERTWGIRLETEPVLVGF